MAASGRFWTLPESKCNPIRIGPENLRTGPIVTI